MAWSDDEFMDEPQTDDEFFVDILKQRSRAEDAASPFSNRTEEKKYFSLATCGGNQVSIYEVSNQPGSSLRCIQSYVDVDDKEAFNACVFAGRSYGEPIVLKDDIDDDDDDDDDSSNPKSPPRITGRKRNRPDNAGDDQNSIDIDDNQDLQTPLSRASDADHRRGPMMVCAAGSRGIIKVIDPVRKSICIRMMGHGGDVFDLKRSPADEWMILSGSADQSIRCWNLRTASCIAMFAGNEGHLGGVISVSWHVSGMKFASSGLDNAVRLWSMDEPVVQHKIHQSQSLKVRPWDVEHAEPCFQPTMVQSPYFSSTKLHNDYVDCIQFVEDLLLSKSTNNTIILWMPINKAKDSNVASLPSSSDDSNSTMDYVVFRTFLLTDCENWFMRFGTTPDLRFLALGNAKGKIMIWDIDSPVDAKPITTLTLPNKQSVRNVSFSPNQKSMVVCCDDSTVWKFDVTVTTSSNGHQR